MSDAHKPSALIVGVGEATGTAVARRLSATMPVALVARSGERIERLAGELEQARAYTCDVADVNAWRRALAEIRTDVGVPSRIVINTEAGEWGTFDTLSAERFAHSFYVNVVSLLVLAQCLLAGTQREVRLVINSSRAATYEPTPQFVGIGPSRSAQRYLAETLDQILASSGVRFSTLVIDGAIDEPNMRAAFPDQPDDFFIRPDDIATKVVQMLDRAEANWTLREDIVSRKPH